MKIDLEEIFGLGVVGVFALSSYDEAAALTNANWARRTWMGQTTKAIFSHVMAT